ncbi:TPA: 50S ribosomal protein L9 [Candidatus Poribacteria bacterium]|jgi:large subunit ribosomal protein L9|nr:50S ribosomal protein L9 [Candidatus Poribacteria bacterium]HIA65722.1 50S ribosomal protein L9 [Candidatus Poribacteria bacterium]HIB89300.1 50S ribosomal protein L9 [Candidatus Poribacteria bacterium]HIC03191.1 50S ribosomal protein L9 [Candidatus Poribacteria bacterium]HIC18968.1 50S ribosomal protein L9 [Candidatus Poribacteria bacterium]
MEVILKKTFSKLGTEGDIVNVADGYARNYLVPTQIAVRSTERNRRMLEHEKKVLASLADKTRDAAEELARRFAEVTCTLKRRAGENDRLFGSVTSADIIAALVIELSVKIDRRDVQLQEPIKDLGIFTVPIQLHPDVTSDLKVVVVRE